MHFAKNALTDTPYLSSSMKLLSYVTTCKDSLFKKNARRFTGKQANYGDVFNYYLNQFLNWFLR